MTLGELDILDPKSFSCYPTKSDSMQRKFSLRTCRPVFPESSISNERCTSHSSDSLGQFNSRTPVIVKNSNEVLELYSNI